MSFPVALVVFLVTAAVVVFCGIRLAKYGDLLAIKTGWGRLWVGTLLLAGATSLPELVTGASGSPELVQGNVFGANMLNMFTVTFVAMLFGAPGLSNFHPVGSYLGRLTVILSTGARRFFDGVAPEHAYLAIVGIALTGVAGILAAFGPAISFARIGVAAPLILVIYVIGM